LIALGKQNNEVRAEHERAIQELKQHLSQKAETDLSNAEFEHRQVVAKLREELVSKDEKIKHLEK
jgi:molybdopterin converting factor small subunit